MTRVDVQTVVTPSDVELRTREVGRRLLDRARASRGWWHGLTQRLTLAPMMRSDELRTASLRFVDVLPALRNDTDLAAHLGEYFSDVNLPLLPARWRGGLLALLGRGVLARGTAAAVRFSAERMALSFIAGHSIASVQPALLDLHRRGMGFTLDLLGEAVVSEAEAAGYHRQYLDLLAGLDPVVRGWPARPLLDGLSGRTAPRLNLSLKASALYSQINGVDPAGSADAIKAKLRPILLDARSRGAFITLDMEHYDTKDIALRVFRELLMESGLRDWPDAGIAIQAYLRDTPGDIAALIAWAKHRDTPVMVRLVRGAYWDFETVHARQHGWPIPVWTRKEQTDACYEHCLALLLSAHPHVETAVATHNVRSLALGIALAEKMGLSPFQYETQMLYGMADEVKAALVEEGVRLRVYVPFGELIPGMAYLVRRLLENTASQSFLRMGFSEDTDADELLAAPLVEIKKAPFKRAADTESASHHQGPTISIADPLDGINETPASGGPAMPLSPFTNEPVRRFTDPRERESFARALEEVRPRLGGSYPLVIDGREIHTEQKLTSLNPAHPSQIVGVASSASREHVHAAVQAALRAFPGWRDTPVQKRADILSRAAALIRDRRDELAAWEVFETGKPWREADADLTEAIDFLEYYGREAVRLWHGHNLDVPGETNRYTYQPRGVGAVIAPWNFPMAILGGMASAALAAGNTVLLKPAPQTPVIAAHFVRILHEAGLPPGVLNFLPGGDETGDAMVGHPAVKFIAFTGSVAVGKLIAANAAQVAEGQHHLKHVVAELGGKNAVIVDSDADVDDAVLGVVASAFGYAGQKCSACSRAIIVGDLYEPFLNRLKEAAASLHLGDPVDPGTALGPVIDQAAYDRIRKTIEIAATYCRPILPEKGAKPLFDEGYYIAPTIFADVPPDSDLAQNEVFGPVLAVMRARDFDHALQIANGTRYALTGGVYSRSPAHLQLARERFNVGNLYLNRKITGAVVNRQPFGGFNLSGTDAKAGGPDYLLHFVEPRHVTENTLRRGFAPQADVHEAI